MVHLALTALTLVLAAAGAGPAHPNSISRSLLVVEGARLELTLRCQALSVIELFPELDPDGDQRLSAEELGAARAPLGAYLAAAYRIYVPHDGLQPLESRLETLGPAGDVPAGRLDLQWIEARFVLAAATEVERLGIEVELFRETSPMHRDLAGVVWNGEEEVRRLSAPGGARWIFEPAAQRRPGVLGAFFRLGVEHILFGWDHLAFLVALLVASSRWRALVAVVTAFTVAHSITLALAVMNPGGLLDRIPDRFVELAIALSIAYVAAETLLRREARNPWIEAFAFGLLHGLGFASFIGAALAAETLVVTALLGFNLGVEAGQLAVVCVLAVVLVLGQRLRRRVPEEGATPALVPRRLRMVVSAGVALVGLYWFVERAGWL